MSIRPRASNPLGYATASGTLWLVLVLADVDVKVSLQVTQVFGHCAAADPEHENDLASRDRAKLLYEFQDFFLHIKIQCKVRQKA